MNLGHNIMSNNFGILSVKLRLLDLKIKNKNTGLKNKYLITCLKFFRWSLYSNTLKSFLFTFGLNLIFVLKDWMEFNCF